ncbi:MAG: SpoIID/LytB domain-containing protein [Clostridia bacterium]|nr:SpoIID/LytB domain-containing protein [Clostridia bacterium]
MKKRLVSLLCLLLCALFLPVTASAEEPAPSVRVLLRRLALTDRADLILDGVYTAQVNGQVIMSFPRGAKVTVAIRGNDLYLFYEGMTMRLGGEVLFIRNASGGDDGRTGIRFEKNGSLYPGDLRLKIKDGILFPVCTMSVEDYLLGVVPYEMSEYFPLEALKAQAVCARTYALNKLGSNPDYDVVDTTNDQVFKGVNHTYVNAKRAVRETAGVVGTYKGKLAICYYSASNGGQTELVQNVWSGRGDWDYYIIADDPYDVENPESVVRRARVAKNGNVREDFRLILHAQVLPQLLQQGYIPEAEHFRVDGISAMTLGTPAFDAPSRSYTEMTVTFAWSGRKWIMPEAEATPVPAAEEEEEEFYFFATPAPTATPIPTVTPESSPTPAPTPYLSDFIPAEGEATVTVQIFPDVIDALLLSVYGANNELLTITETDTHFVVEARRYGHGVGMSQRGAQWMAGQYGKTYQEIMAFYYPGMTLSRVDAGTPALPTTPAELAATLAPPATPTPRPTLMPVTVTDDLPEGAYLAAVTEIDDDSSLNLREEPSQGAAILRRLYKHQRLIVLETCEDPAWVKVRTDVIEGYVMASFITPVTGEAPAATPAPTPGFTPAPAE